MCLGHPGLFKCQMLVTVARALTRVYNALWLELLGQPRARLLCQPTDSVSEPGATGMVPGSGAPLKDSILVMCSLSPSWLSLPPFPASQTLWSQTLWTEEGYVGWPGKQRKGQRPDGEKPRQRWAEHARTIPVTSEISRVGGLCEQRCACPSYLHTPGSPQR